MSVRRQLLSTLIGALGLVSLAVVLAPVVGVVVGPLSRAEGFGAVAPRALRATLATAKLVVVATAIAAPVGMIVGYATTLRRREMLRRVAVTTVDVLGGIPPIVLGLAAGAATSTLSGAGATLGGGLALALGIAPRIARSVADRLATLAESVRDAGVALGVPRWRLALGLEARSIARWVAGVVLFAAAATAGEVAPLLYVVATSRWIRGSEGAPAPLAIEVFDALAGELTSGEAHMLAFMLFAVVGIGTWGARRLAYGRWWREVQRG
jgi:ABC-type phosphate transport system permease subunit